MDIDSLKEALGDETFSKLKTYVTDLVGQRDAARQEAITGRKGKDTKITELQARVAALSDRLGVDIDADLETLPDVKGAAEASKQYEARLKRAERERDEAKQRADKATADYRGTLQRAAVSEAMSAHKFIAPEIVGSHIASQLVWEGDELLFKADGGKLVPVKDGVAGFAKLHPQLLEPQGGAGGAGVRQPHAGGGGGKTISEAEFNAKSPAEQARLMSEGHTLIS